MDNVWDVDQDWDWHSNRDWYNTKNLEQNPMGVTTLYNQWSNKPCWSLIFLLFYFCLDNLIVNSSSSLHILINWFVVSVECIVCKLTVWTIFYGIKIKWCCLHTRDCTGSQRYSCPNLFHSFIWLERGSQLIMLKRRWPILFPISSFISVVISKGKKW